MTQRILNWILKGHAWLPMIDKVQDTYVPNLFMSFCTGIIGWNSKIRIRYKENQKAATYDRFLEILTCNIGLALCISHNNQFGSIVKEWEVLVLLNVFSYWNN